MTGPELVAARVARKLTQGELARALKDAGHGASPAQVCRWERGEVVPPDWLSAALERVPGKEGPAKARGSYGGRKPRRYRERVRPETRRRSAGDDGRADPSKVRKSRESSDSARPPEASEVSAGDDILDAAVHAICLDDLPEVTGAEIHLPSPRPPLVVVRRRP
jgi:hypothetical protein